MYPFIRMFKELWKYRNAPRLDLTGTHVFPSHVLAMGH